MLRYPLCELPAGAQELREEVRAFLRAELGTDAQRRPAYSWFEFDPEFSLKVGARGWIGMTWPREYGGGERSVLERWVVQEEMLAACAPVLSHWTADRQYGPLLLRFGSESQRKELLPRMARGELSFAIAMSEPDAGSDLAAVRTRATRVSGGFELHGTKIWTSGAHIADFAMALVRTDSTLEGKHAGLSQLIVDLRAPGITVRPIPDISAECHFNEVHFDGCFVPLGNLVGREGDGWKQVTSELAYERSGPDRYLSSIGLLREFVRRAGDEPAEHIAAAIGRLVARKSALRNLSLSVASILQDGGDPALEAALVKDVGTHYEQSTPERVHEVMAVEPRIGAGSELERAHAWTILHAPSFTIRGGAREVVRGIVARGLGLR